jgi:hypothetical protein
MFNYYISIVSTQDLFLKRKKAAKINSAASFEHYEFSLNISCYGFTPGFIGDVPGNAAGC